MVALLISILATILGLGLVFWFARHRAVGTPLTWGEAFVAGLFAFWLMFLVYGIVPHQWLAYADNDLQWRKDKIGVPAGPAGALFGTTENDWVSNDGNVFFPNGVPLLNGHLTVSAEAIRDLVAGGIYIVALGGQIALWAYWQKRGKERPKEIPTSAYGRPLVKREA